MLFLAVVLALIGQLAWADRNEQLTLSSATSDFSQRLYQKVALDKPNVVYSPYSIHSALSMTSLGAKGDTDVEIKQALGVTSMGGTVHKEYKKLIQDLNAVNDVQLHTGNAIFVNPNYQIVPQFMEDTSNYYFALSDNFNMSAEGGPEKPINDYIANKTENMIKDVLQPGSIDGSTVMILVNTIFFNGTWDEQFKKSKTRDQDFKQLDGTNKSVDMMHDDRYLNIKRDKANGVDIAELPFKRGRFSIYIALPQKVDGITDLEKILAQPEKVKDFFTGLTSVRVQLRIPKFKIETTLDLNSTLKDLGIVKSFNPDAANFTGITQSAKVYISQVLHKAMIDVQETGTVAAAVTVLGMGTTSIETETTETFIADHAFVYFLRDNQTGQILFQGKFSG